MGVLKNAFRGNALGNECSHDGAADHALMARNINFAAMHFGTPRVLLSQPLLLDFSSAKRILLASSSISDGVGCTS
jgi:hypothetical protein